MNRYIKLVNMEFNRFFKIYLVLIGITLIMQITGVIVKSNGYVKAANKAIYEQNVPIEQFIQDYGIMSFANLARSIWLMGPIAIVIVTLLIYMVFIWYRDWLGKNTFIYRLLMLPTERITVYAAKATVIMLFTLGMVALQILFLHVDAQILKWMVPDEYRFDMTIRQMLTTFDSFGIIFPYSFAEFILHYGLGFIAMTVVFTMILFERSFRLKGILFGILYGIAAGFVFAMPLLLHFLVFNEKLYPNEIFTAEIVAALIILAASIWTSHILLKKKIRV